METEFINLKIILPYRIFADVKEVKRIVVETADGCMGILPHRLDCASKLVPGLLTYETKNGEEIFVAVDEGVIVKAGAEVFISVRNAIGGVDLGKLRETIEKEFKNLTESEKSTRVSLAKLESAFARKFMEFRHEK
ncbi:MAG: F0F1 ATP synthase subunit epsilon [Lentisphaerota bacterium]